jgi:peptidoglycan/LPS O-acetylase OafA/YrhL
VEYAVENEHKYWKMYTATHFRIDSLLVGVWLSYYYHFHRPRFFEVMRRYRMAIKLAALFFAVMFFFNSALGLHKALLYPMGFLCWLSVLALGITSASLARWTTDKHNFPLRFLVFSGFYSYNIYLWHMPVIRWAELYFPFVLEIKAHFGLSLLFYTSSSILVGVVVTKLIEAPLLKIRDKRFPSKFNVDDGKKLQKET